MIAGRTQCTTCAARTDSVLCRLSEDEATLFEATSKTVAYGKGQTIFQQGALPRVLYCVSRGKVKLVQEGTDGREQIIHLAKNGDLLGYRAIVGNDRYSCSAVAIEDTEVCCIPRQVFLDTLRKNPELSFRLMLLFAAELKDAERKITTIAQRPVRERLAQSLLLLKDSYGFGDDGSTINVSVTREEIANLTGTTRETAIRVLFELNDEKVIGLHAKKIAILDEPRLTTIANLSE